MAPLQVGVADANDPSNRSCSGGFTLTALDDIVVDSDADFVKGLAVTSPETGDLAYVGEEYTVLVSNGFDLRNRVLDSLRDLCH